MDICLVDAFHIDALHTTADGFQQLVGLFANHDEHRLLRRFLDEFQQFVGTFDVHPLWQPYHAYLITTLTRLQTQFADQVVALTSGDDGLLVFAAHGLHPLVHSDVESLCNQRVPLLGKVIAHGLMVSSHGGQFDGRVGEV